MSRSTVVVIASSVQNRGMAESADKSVILFSQSKSPPTLLSQVYKLIPKSIDDATYETNATRDTFLKFAEEGKRGVFVLSIFNREELMDVIGFLPVVKSAIKERRILVVVILKTYTDKIEEVLVRSGVYEVLRYDVNAKAFLYKMKRYLVYIRGTEGEETQDVAVTDKPGSRNTDEGSNDRKVRAYGSGDDHSSATVATRRSSAFKKGIKILIVDPVDSQYDFWLFRKKVYAKKFKGKWLIEIIGPSLAAGKWVQTQEFNTLFPDQPQIWKWVWRNNPEKFGETFNPKPGTWVYSGSPPEFSWTMHRWGFVSNIPEMAFVEFGKIIHRKFNLNADQDLCVADNSKYGIELFNQIKDTFDRDYYLELEKLQGGIAYISPDDASNIPWNDNSNSKDLNDRDWNNHSLNSENGNETPDLADREEERPDLWQNQLGEDQASSFEEPNPASMQAEEDLDGAPADELAELDIPLGAEAMKDCGIRARLKDVDIDLLNYSEQEFALWIGVRKDLLAPKEMVEIEVESENLKDTLNFDLRGIVMVIDDDGSDRVIVKIALHSESYPRLKKIRQAIERRQEEILLFFNRVKGIA